jgi:hypothetical protein
MTLANYAFIQNGNVINIAVFEYPIDPQLLSHFKNEFLLDDIVLANEKTYIGGTYDGTKFWAISPFSSWVKDEETNEWVAPISKPDTDNFYVWNEETLSWSQE